MMTNFTPERDEILTNFDYFANLTNYELNSYDQGPDLYAFIGFIGFIGPDDVNYMC